ncbi:LexA family protein [Phenylobacterium immobile]|uniref:LexA family protein n=1 Tax=Phenylobacterium immobile TaxID=21 RepID=UPI000B803B68|nr:LexA family transcriptional regulator [Phenylobacterium immobile]
MSDYKVAAVAYLRDVIEKTGKTASELADLVGISHTTFTRPLKNADYKYAIKFPTIQRLAEMTNVPLPPNLASGAGRAPTSSDPRIVPQFLGVRYRVRAGLWQEMDSEEAPEQIDYAVAPSHRYADWPQWLERVEGDSVNQKIPHGHYAHVVDARAMGYSPKTGDWVVVERHRDQGAIRERTIKQVEITETGAVVLWPRSDNPKWSAPVDLLLGARQDEDIEAFIVGLVIGAYNPAF